MGYWVVKILFGPIVRWVWVKRVEGLENIPKKGACIIAANHSSYFDFICLIAIIPRRIRFLAAEKFYKSKFWYPLIKLTGQIKVDRKSPNKSKVYQLVYSTLEQGRIIGIFPEGTRSPNGKIGRTFTGIARFALKAKVPVVPVGISGTYEIMSRFDKRPKLTKKAIIKIGKPIYFNEYYSRDYAENDFRIITDKIMLEIAKLAGKEYLCTRIK